ncbi:hypothetical protein SDJN02_20660 [Cucurbita argyrosperma subsp. argyrosperma]
MKLSGSCTNIEQEVFFMWGFISQRNIATRWTGLMAMVGENRWILLVIVSNQQEAQILNFHHPNCRKMIIFSTYGQERGWFKIDRSFIG